MLRSRRAIFGGGPRPQFRFARRLSQKGCAQQERVGGLKSPSERPTVRQPHPKAEANKPIFTGVVELLSPSCEIRKHQSRLLWRSDTVRRSRL
jgi:hypothetical protein